MVLPTGIKERSHPLSGDETKQEYPVPVWDLEDSQNREPTVA